jgi:LPPG:FO 2-phospho-L-lactate transferase
VARGSRSGCRRRSGATSRWGLLDETWVVSETLAERGVDAWFRLGDRDIATHLVRTERLRDGERPTDVARALARQLDVAATVLPMTDEVVRTELRTDDGWLGFQDYFVRLGQRPTVHAVRFRGIEEARASADVLEAIGRADVIVVAPSNPIVSTGPILALPGIRDALRAATTRGVPIVAVSGIVGGRALKGPADRMLASLGHESSARGVATLYAGVADAFVLDEVDRGLEPAIAELGMRTLVTDTIMSDGAARARLAREILDFAAAA